MYFNTEHSTLKIAYVVHMNIVVSVTYPLPSYARVERTSNDRIICYLRFVPQDVRMALYIDVYRRSLAKYRGIITTINDCVFLGKFVNLACCGKHGERYL